MFKISFLLLSIIFPNPFLDLSLELIVDDFEKPIYAVFSPLDQNGNSTMLVLEQGGMIYMISNNSKKIFLDWEQYTQTPLYPGDERGLFCLAFDPSYNINRKIYIYYMDKNDVSIVSQFEVTPDFLSVDEESEIEILRIEQPYSNHNGGQIAFDNEGYFYIGLGDGGSAGDPLNNGQNLRTIFGKILRIKINSQTGTYQIPLDNPFYNHIDFKQEIWLYGIRNPWRFSFDMKTNDMYIGDVGQSNWEEINFHKHLDNININYGWNIKEGMQYYKEYSTNENVEQYIDPIYAYPNNANYLKTLLGFGQNDLAGCSVTGGYVYRGKQVDGLQGYYIFGDYCTGRVWLLDYLTSKQSQVYDITSQITSGIQERNLFLSSFAQDRYGEIYLVNYSGSVYKLVNSK